MKFLYMSLLMLVTTAINAQETNYPDWVEAGQPALQSNGAIPAIPFGIVLTVFADLSSFQAAGTVTAFEDFEGGLVAAGAVATCTPPINSLSNDVCFAPGDLIAGFSLGATGAGSNLIIVLGTGLLGNADVVIGANSFLDVTILTFDALNVTAVAFDLQTNAAGPVDVLVFDTMGVLIDILNIAASPAFVGFISPTAIGSIELEEITGGGELINNLRFGHDLKVPIFKNGFE